MTRDENPLDGARVRESALSPGHNPPRFVDRALPTHKVGIHADGGPGKPTPGAVGTNPWTLGSMTIGTGHILLVDYFKFETSTPNVWFKLRHNHPSNLAGSTPTNQPGGTLEAWHLAARGGRGGDVPPRDSAFIAVPPGTLTLMGFGAGSLSPGTSSNLAHRTLGTRGVDRFYGAVRGQLVG